MPRHTPQRRSASLELHASDSNIRSEREVNATTRLQSQARVRKFSRKSRNGCMQCKNRRVKCKEQRPACDSCVLREVDCIYNKSSEASPLESSNASTDTITTRLSSLSERNLGSLSHVDSDLDRSDSRQSAVPTFVTHPAQMPTPPISDNVNYVSESVPNTITNLESVMLNESTLEHRRWLDARYQSMSALQTATAETESSSLPIESAPAVLDYQDSQLEPFFRSFEEMSLFRHFTAHTASTMNAIYVPPAENPWILNFAALATIQPHSTSVIHDGFRYALLSLASIDKEHAKSETVGLSKSFKTQALKLMQVATDADLSDSATIEADIAVAASIALFMRDKFDGDESWEISLTCGDSVIKRSGGPVPFLDLRDTPTRRFLVEQLVCLEILALASVLRPSELLHRLEDWFLSGPPAGTPDHVELVYGLDRQTLQLGVVAAGLWGDFIRLQDLQQQLKTLSRYAAVEQRYVNMKLQHREKVFALSCQTASIEDGTQLDLQKIRLVLGNRMFKSSIDIWISQMLSEHPSADWIARLSAHMINEIGMAVEAGWLRGLLFATRAAAEVATDPGARNTILDLLTSLGRGYRQETEIARRTSLRIWEALDSGNGVDDCPDFPLFLKTHLCYVPVF